MKKISASPLCTLTLATYNLRVPCDKPPNDWDSRRDRVRWMIAKHHFDIFGVQEAVKRQVDDVLAGTTYAKIGGGRDDFKDAGEHSWGKFRDKATGKTFCYYNTHLDHVSEEARVKGIRMVVAHAKENCGAIPLVLTGDFNARPDSETYRIASKLLRDAAVISKTVHKGPARTFHHWGRHTLTRNEPIDYIFVSKDVAVLSHVTDGTRPLGGYASDHYPVIAKLQF